MEVRPPSFVVVGWSQSCFDISHPGFESGQTVEARETTIAVVEGSGFQQVTSTLC